MGVSHMFKCGLSHVMMSDVSLLNTFLTNSWFGAAYSWECPKIYAQRISFSASNCGNRRAKIL